MNCLWEVWSKHPEFVLPTTDYTLSGFSIAALRTNFYIKELNILFDAGISGYMAPDFIFITHAHGDHIANIPFHILNPRPDRKIQIFVPKEVEKMVESYIMSLYAANDATSIVHKAGELKEPEHYYSKNYQIVGVTAGEIYNLEIKGKKFIVSIIKCDHSVPCVGYGFSECRTKLKKEYIGLPGKEIKALKDKGESLTEIIEMHNFCFLGDTSSKIIEEEYITKYKTIIMECTFIHDDELDRADLTKHTHWKGIETFIKDHPDNMFVLYHFSQRYKKEEICEFFKSVGYANVHPWISNA
jgi:ribonuclease Z